MAKIINFIRSASKELVYKVSWPRQQKLQNMIGLFAIGLFVCSFIVGGINIFLKKVVNWVYGQF